MLHFFIRSGNKYVRIDTHQILYIEALKNYVRIVTRKGTYLMLISMRQISEELPSLCFCRIHRSFIVAIQHIDSFDRNAVRLGEICLPISPYFKSELLTRIKLITSDTRVCAQER